MACVIVVVMCEFLRDCVSRSLDEMVQALQARLDEEMRLKAAYQHSVEELTTVVKEQGEQLTALQRDSDLMRQALGAGALYIACAGKSRRLSSCFVLVNWSHKDKGARNLMLRVCR